MTPPASNEGTPRTDAYCSPNHRGGIYDFARTLERENQSLARRVGELEGDNARLLRGMADTAEAFHAATAHAKAEDIAAYFIDTILKTQWDKDHMTRVLEGWLTKHLSAARTINQGDQS